MTQTTDLEIIYCEDCRYWDQTVSQAYDYGYCRRYPPKPVAENYYLLPKTYRAVWCGEGRKRLGGQEAGKLGG